MATPGVADPAATHSINPQVRAFWERQPCGTDPALIGHLEPGTDRWFRQIEEYRYRVEPMIHAVAQFTRHRGKRVLEVGVGAGTDHLQWARAGAICCGVDLTDAAIETTRAHLALDGLTSDLRRADAEALPFEDAAFDVVYSWGVIHHSDRPDRIVSEIRRVLRPGGQFIGMLYGRHSLTAIKVWAKQALLRGRPLRSLSDVLWHHVESIGTKAYTPAELRALFGAFRAVEVQPLRTVYDSQGLPPVVGRFVPDDWGWFIAVRAHR